VVHVWFSIFSIIKIDWKFEETKRIINQKISIEHTIQWEKEKKKKIIADKTPYLIRSGNILHYTENITVLSLKKTYIHI
jgi:hypothetical protein